MPERNASTNRNIFRKDTLFLVSVFLFIIVNWVLLTLTEQLGPPDFYKLHAVAEKLYSGNLKVGIVPPLFPLILYPLGKLISIFVKPELAFMIAGRLIALAASLGVTWFTYLLLKKFTGKYALIGISLMAVSPWFLKLTSFPITDMLYLCLASAAFYRFSMGPSTWKSGLITSILGVLTRFEGILLLLSGGITFLKGKLNKKGLRILLGVMLLGVVAVVFFLVFTPRFFAHFRDIILPKQTYLNIFLHPLDFLNVIYANILYMVPHGISIFLKWGLFSLVLISFGYGVFRLFKINRSLTISLLVYQVLFFMAKGYIDVNAPEREFRRVLSGLWIFYIIAFIGCYFLLRKIKLKEEHQAIAITAASAAAVWLIVALKLISPLYLLPALLLVPAFYFPIRSLTIKPPIKYGAMVILLALTFQCYFFSYQKSAEYVDSYANKAAYAAAKWFYLKSLDPGTRVLIYTDMVMMEYYLQQKKQELDANNIQRIHYVLPLDLTKKTREYFTWAFHNEAKRHNVHYVIFDNYVVQQPEFRRINEIKRILYDQRNNRKHYRLKNLFYKGKNVAYALKVVYDSKAVE